MSKCDPGCCLIAEARGPIYECDGKCAYDEGTDVDARRLLEDCAALVMRYGNLMRMEASHEHDAKHIDDVTNRIKEHLARSGK